MYRLTLSRPDPESEHQHYIALRLDGDLDTVLKLIAEIAPGMLPGTQFSLSLEAIDE